MQRTPGHNFDALLSANWAGRSDESESISRGITFFAFWVDGAVRPPFPAPIDGATMTIRLEIRVIQTIR